MEILRIIDANLNRAREGIRVIEEICRFYLNHETLFVKLKHLRHLIKEGEKSFSKKLVLFRQSEEDVGRDPNVLENRKGLKDIVAANSKRVEESLRVLEEFSKIYNARSELFKEARFNMYELEKIIELSLSKPADYSLYLITDDIYLSNRSLILLIEKCLDAGVTMLQYRAKEKQAREMLKDAEKLRRLTGDKKIPLIINDRIDLALAVDADGVHLGQEDFPIEQAQKYIGDKIIGVSASTYKEAEEAIIKGADYIGLGPIYPTATKKDAKPACGLQAIREVRKRYPETSIVAIGGINVDNAKDVMASGADGLAIISAILGSEEPAKEAGRFKKIVGGI